MDINGMINLSKGESVIAMNEDACQAFYGISKQEYDLLCDVGIQPKSIGLAEHIKRLSLRKHKTDNTPHPTNSK